MFSKRTKIFLNLSIRTFNTRDSNIVKIRILIYVSSYNLFFPVFKPNTNIIFYKNKKKFLLKLF